MTNIRAVNSRDRQTLRSVAALLVSSIFLAGCASTPSDPFEGYNRAMSTFNNGVDRLLLKPAATGYRNFVPAPVAASVTRAFANLADPWTATNQLLQGRISYAGNDASRFIVNSTLGVAGLFDVATRLGLPKHNEGFDQTLAVWGVPQGPYIVLPMLGPSSGRGLFGQLTGNFGGDLGQPLRLVDNVPIRNSLFFTQLVSMRATLLDRPPFPPQADQYSLLRDFYLRRVEQQVAQ